jgi:hypothetical protein
MAQPPEYIEDGQCVTGDDLNEWFQYLVTVAQSSIEDIAALAARVAILEAE